jgi:hypothetical protein
MPRRDIRLLDYQPVVFRLVEPSTDSIADNFTDEETTLYDKILGKCRVFGANWCQVAELTDPVNVQWKASEVGANLWEGNVFRTATVTSTASNKLIDSTATFSTTPGAFPFNLLVLNTATGQSAWITAVDSATQLSLNANIFTSASEPYVIYRTRVNTAGWSLDFSSGVGYIVQYAGGGPSTLEASNPSPLSPMLRANKWNRVTLRVPQYNYGSFDVVVNGPSGPLATYTIASAGEFEFYVWGEPLFVTTFSFIVSVDFSGTIDLFSLEIFEVNDSYSLVALDLAGNPICGQTITFGDSASDTAMFTGNVVYQGTWADFTEECGCVRLALIDEGNPPECEGELIPNTDFSDEGALWSGPENIFFPCEDEACDCGACFNSETTSPAALSIGLNCPLEEGRDYCVSVEVCNILTSLGWFAEIGVFIPETSGQTIGQIPGSSSSGVYNFTFTATGPATGFYIIFNDTNIYGCINSVSLSVCEPISPYYALSECFKLCPQGCTTEISYRNDSNAYGLNYEFDPNYRNFTRNTSRIINQTLRDNSLSVFKSGRGIGNNPYHDGLRVADFNQGPAPAYYHMVLSTALAHSDCRVDGVRVMRISEYQPDWSDSYELARATTEVQFRNQDNLRNTR